MNIERKYIISPKNNIMKDDDIAIINSGELVIVLEKFELELINKLDGRLKLKDISIQLEEKYSETYVEADFYNFITELFNFEVIEEIYEDQ